MRIDRDSTYFEHLKQRVIEKSWANIWEKAVSEWELCDYKEDESKRYSCICGKEKLRHLFTIRNTRNLNVLYPIGSTCIKKFGRDDLNKEVKVLIQLFKLYHAIENKECIALCSTLFSRNLLHYLFKHGVFKPSRCNKYDPKNDYEFLLKMFNKGAQRTEGQKNKVNAIMLNSIKPFLREKFGRKMLD